MKKYFYGGGFFLLLFVLIGWFLFYEKPNIQTHTEIKEDSYFLDKKKNTEFTYSILLSKGYLTIAYGKFHPYIGGIKVYNCSLALKQDSFTLNGKSKDGLIKNSKFIINNFYGNICNNYTINAKKLSIFIRDSHIDLLKVKDFKISKDNFMLFSKKERIINPKIFCSYPLSIFNH
jgi:hypothetical protein